MSKWRVGHIAVEKGRSTALRVVLEDKTSDETQTLECLLPLDRNAILNGYPCVERAIRTTCQSTPISACFPFDLPLLVSKVRDTLDIDEDDILEMKIRSCITEADLDLTVPKVIEKVINLEGDLALLTDCLCDKNMRKNLSFIFVKRCENRLLQEVILHKPQIASDIVRLLSDDNTSIVSHVLHAIQLLIYKPHVQRTEQSLSLPPAGLSQSQHDSIYDLALRTVNVDDMRRDNCDILISADNADLIFSLCQSVCVYCSNESSCVDVNVNDVTSMHEDDKRPSSTINMPQDVHIILARARLVLECIIACSNDCLVLLLQSIILAGRNILSSIVTALSGLATRQLTAESEQFSCDLNLFWILVQLYVTLESRLIELGCDLDFESVHRLFSTIIFSNCKTVDPKDGSRPNSCKLLLYSYALLRCYKLFYTANSASKALLTRCFLHNSNVLLALVHIISGCCPKSSQLSLSSSEPPFDSDTLQWYRTQLEADCSVLLCLFFFHNSTNPLLLSLLRSRQVVLSKASLHLPAAELKLKHLFASCPHLQVSHSSVESIFNQPEESVTIFYVLSPLQQESLQRFCLSRLKSQLLFNSNVRLNSTEASTLDGIPVSQSQGIVEVLADIVCQSKSSTSTIPVECLRLIHFYYTSCTEDPLSVRHLFEWASALRTKVLNKLSDRLEIELFAEPVCEVGLSIIHQLVSCFISPSALRGSGADFSGRLTTKPWYNSNLLGDHSVRQHAGVTVEKSDVAKLLTDIASMRNLPMVVQSYLQDALQMFGHSSEKIHIPQPPNTAHVRGFRRPATTQSVAVVIRPLPPATPRSMSSSGGQPLGFRRHQLR